MKTSLLTALISTLLAGSALAAPAPVPLPKAAPAKAAAPAPLPAKDIFGDAVRTGFKLGAVADGFRIARCECEDTKEVCEKPCELWNQNGSCAKWGLPVCVETCVKWSCEDKH